MLINGKVEGDPNASVASFGKIEEAASGQLSFLANPKYEEFLYSTRASVIIIDEAQELKEPINATLIRVPDAYSAFATLLTKYQEIQAQKKFTGEKWEQSWDDWSVRRDVVRKKVDEFSAPAQPPKNSR